MSPVIHRVVLSVVTANVALIVFNLIGMIWFIDQQPTLDAYVIGWVSVVVAVFTGVSWRPLSDPPASASAPARGAAQEPRKP